MASRSDHRRWPGLDYPHGPGECRWCGELILTADGMIKRRRAFCSRRCSHEYELRADWRAMRRFVFKRDQGACQECGVCHEFGEWTWEADHIRPLWAARDWTAWDPDNVQTLCRDPCHRQKTRLDLRKFRSQRRLVERFRRDPPMRGGQGRAPTRKPEQQG